VLLALCVPKPALAPLGWVALAPLCLAVLRTAQLPSPRGARPFMLGLVTGLVAFGGTVSWTSEVLAVFGGLNLAVSWALTGVLIAYLAIYPALFSVMLTATVARAGPQAVMLAPVVWVAFEWLRGTVFTGFPWVLLGYSQSDTIAPLQVASLVGIYGLSALVALPAAALALLLAPGPRGRGHGRIAATAIGVVALAWAWGAWRVGQQALFDGPIARVGIVQGNVPQDQKWDPAHRDDILRRYLDLTRQVAALGVDLVIWPESSTPFVFGRDALPTEIMRAAVVRAGVPVVFGSDEIEGAGDRFYNAAFLIDPSGEVRGSYRKMQLVPFGEYVPLRSLLFFAQPLVERTSDFSAGERVTLLPLGGHKLSVAVCYEAVFPWLSRQAVRDGSQLLTTVTNDAWYGRSAAPYQHFEQARVRAVETGRYLVRAANTGISGVVDPYGRVLVRSPLFETGVYTGEVRWLSGATVYTRIGDSVPWACMLVTVLLIVVWRWPVRPRWR